MGVEWGQDDVETTVGICFGLSEAGLAGFAAGRVARVIVPAKAKALLTFYTLLTRLAAGGVGRGRVCRA